MKVVNAATGKPYTIPDETWQQVKDAKHVKGVLIPQPPVPIPAEVIALQQRKDKGNTPAVTIPEQEA